ncbi:MAG TPA: cation transporter [Bryobacteraceae bacterium]|nr:cation transporter [Bryobacteraceae bacterium]
MPDRSGHIARGLKLEYATVAYNSLEGLIAIAAGLYAGSISLVGFGADSIIEVTSAAAMIWRLQSDVEHKRERSERVALRIVGVCFCLLAIYVALDALKTLVHFEEPRASIPGIALAVTSLIVMPLLSRAKCRVAGSIGSAALKADARQTELCTYLSAILLGGLLMNALFGWWWADPIAALIMVPIIAREGISGLRGKTACACH